MNKAPEIAYVTSDAFFTKVMRDYLSDIGKCNVTLLSTFQEAKEILAKKGFDAIVIEPVNFVSGLEGIPELNSVNYNTPNGRHDEVGKRVLTHLVRDANSPNKDKYVAIVMTFSDRGQGYNPIDYKIAGANEVFTGFFPPEKLLNAIMQYIEKNPAVK